MPSFTKTRMVYYDNNINSLTSTNRDTNITIGAANINSGSSGYGIARLKGSVHNWSAVPMNKYGLYLSANELYYLYNSSSKIIPKNLKVCLGHCVPIAKYPGTTNTTQLSFNNTIYSLIYELHDLNDVTTADDFDRAGFTNFRQTYDGAQYSNNNRNNLPKPDLLFKFPDYLTALLTNSEPATVKIAAGSTTFPTTTTVPTGIDAAMTRRDVCYEYVPEFLKDNDNVYVLYPGENQYEYHYQIGDSDYVQIDTNSIQFNESQGILDIRGGYHINSDTRFKEEEHLFQEVCPRVRYDGYLPADDQGNYFAENKRRLDQYFNQDTGSLKDHGPPKIFIKGNPILDDSNNLVSHTFQALITWTIEIDVIPRIEPIPRNLIEGFVVLRREIYRGAGTNITNKTTFSKPYPLKPQTQRFKAVPSGRNRLINNDNPNTATYDPTAVDSGTWEYNPLQWHRGAGKNNTVIETENFNRASMPAEITKNMDVDNLPQDDI